MKEDIKNRFRSIFQIELPKNESDSLKSLKEDDDENPEKIQPQDSGKNDNDQQNNNTSDGNISEEENKLSVFSGKKSFFEAMVFCWW